MRLDKKAKIEKACAGSKDGRTRPVLQHPYLSKVGDDWRLIATDSYKLAMVPVEGHPDDVEGFVSLDAIKAARKTSYGEIVCNGECRVSGDGASYPRPTPGEPPRLDKIIGDLVERDSSGSITIGLNAKLLHELAQAIGTEVVAITIDTEVTRKPLRVTAPAGDPAEAVGILMPVDLERLRNR